MHTIAAQWLKTYFKVARSWKKCEHGDCDGCKMQRMIYDGPD
jgi:hypothetical protein